MRPHADRANVAPFIVMDVLARAKQLEEKGADVLHLEIGQPCAHAPQCVREAAISALQEGDDLGYTPAMGLTALRELIRDRYLRQGLSVPIERIAIVAGSSTGFVTALISAFDAGDAVAMTLPGYPAYKAMLSTLGLNSVTISLSEATGWQITTEQLETAYQKQPFRGLILMSPANPTGTVIPADLMGAVVQWCSKRGVRLLSDEIYQDLDYTGQAVSALQFTDEAIVINSFSKYYAMTGWRLGWMVLPSSLARSFELVQQNLFICPPSIAQRAALAAFDSHDEMDAVRASYQRNRDRLLDALPSLGFGPLLPADGAFYVYAGLSASDPDSLTFCQRLLDEAHVAITPGVDFDEERGGRFVRFSYCCSEDKVSAVIERLKQWRSASISSALAEAS